MNSNSVRFPCPGPSTSKTNHLKRPIAQPVSQEGLPDQPASKKIKPTPIHIIHPQQIYTGSIPQIIHAFKSNPGLNLLYETYGRILSISQGRFQCEKLILLRSVDGTGPVIQGFFYEIDLSLSPACRNGQTIRCMGRFNSQKRFQIIKIGPTNQSFIDSINRLNSFSNFTILRS